jgi:nucleoid DNA-binding protein
MTRQKEILNQLAEEHDITVGQAEEVWKHFIGLISDTIQEPKKDEEGLYDLELFKTIHIDSFGKFVPHQRNILNANKWIKKRRDESKNWR